MGDIDSKLQGQTITYSYPPSVVFVRLLDHTDTDDEDEREYQTGTLIWGQGSEAETGGDGKVYVGHATELLEQTFGKERSQVIFCRGDVILLVRMFTLGVLLGLVTINHTAGAIYLGMGSRSAPDKREKGGGSKFAHNYEESGRQCHPASYSILPGTKGTTLNRRGNLVMPLIIRLGQ